MQNSHLVGVTEGCDPTLNLKWIDWVRSGKPAIIITKMPRLLLPMLQNDNIIVHCTITGLGGSKIEPNIDLPEVSLKYYHQICDLLSPDRVVLRIDPIVYWRGYKPILKSLVKEAEGRVRISFIDVYPHVSQRFTAKNIPLSYNSFHMPLEIRKEIWEELGKPELCCEPDMPSVPCVSKLDCKILGVEPSKERKGQRVSCVCLANKRELLLQPPKCTYGCLYCYWK
jgi:hypothetical protein